MAAEPPDGFEPVFTQHVGRHGSRSLTSNDADSRALALWDSAKAGGELTDLGKKFGPDARALREAMARLGYGDLSKLGEQEQMGIGARTGSRLADLFDRAETAGENVEIVTSGRARTIASADSFVAGLRTERPKLTIGSPSVDARLLKFDTNDEIYSSFLADGSWQQTMTKTQDKSRIAQASRRSLQALYSAEFTAAIDDPVREATAIYELIRVAPGMSKDSGVWLDPYMRASDMAAFAQLEDARVFYSRGPGIGSDDRSFRPAEVLLDDFFDRIDKRVTGGRAAAVFRFAHGEEIVPFAALLKLPGSTKSIGTDEIYTYDQSDFRVANVAGLSANITWDVVQDEAGTSLVTMRYNEVPIRFVESCAASESGGYYYQLEELRKCLPPH